MVSKQTAVERSQWKRPQMLLALPIISIILMFTIDYKLRRSETNVRRVAATYVKLSLIRQSASCANNDARCLVSLDPLDENAHSRKPPDSGSSPDSWELNKIDELIFGHIGPALKSRFLINYSGQAERVRDQIVYQGGNEPGEDELTQQKALNPNDHPEKPSDDVKDSEKSTPTNSGKENKQPSADSTLLKNGETDKVDSPSAKNITVHAGNQGPSKTQPAESRVSEESVQREPKKQSDQKQLAVSKNGNKSEVGLKQIELSSNVSAPKQLTVSSTTNSTKPTKPHEKAKTSENLKQKPVDAIAKISEDIKLPSQAGRDVDKNEVKADVGRGKLQSSVSNPKQMNASLPVNSTKPVNSRDRVQPVEKKKRLEHVKTAANSSEDVKPIPPADRSKELAIPKDFKSLPYPYFHRQLPNAYMYPIKESIYKDATIGFVHSPKSAGTTMKDCIDKLVREQGGKPTLMSFKTASSIRQDLLNEKTVLEKYYMGDSTLGICDYGPERPCTYFTVMREPYDRVVSHYYFCKDGGVSYPTCDNTLEEFVLDSCSLFFRQTTVQFNCQEYEEEECAGYPGCPMSWRCNATEVHPDNLPVTEQQRESILQYVIDRLDRMFAVIGLMEEFETSLKLFQDVFGAKFHDQCKEEHRNFGRYLHRETMFGEGDRTKEQEIESAKQRLRENKDVRRCLSEDERIYKRAKEIFELQKEKYNMKNNLQ